MDMLKLRAKDLMQSDAKTVGKSTLLSAKLRGRTLVYRSTE